MPVLADPDTASFWYAVLNKEAISSLRMTPHE
jgi:hypothetical protein